MQRIFIALAAMAVTATPLLAMGIASGAQERRPLTIGLDHPILLKRMVVVATPLPDVPGR